MSIHAVWLVLFLVCISSLHLDRLICLVCIAWASVDFSIMAQNKMYRYLAWFRLLLPSSIAPVYSPLCILFAPCLSVEKRLSWLRLYWIHSSFLDFLTRLWFLSGSAAVWGTALLGLYAWNSYDSEKGDGGILGALGLRTSSSNPGQQGDLFSQAEMDKWNNAKKEARGREWEKAVHKMRKEQELEKKKEGNV